jgi:small subunit ribosomal protein S20
MPTSNLNHMPITKGAEKALRSSKQKQVFNLRRDRAMKDVTKDVVKAVAAGEVAKAKELLPKAYKAIDKAAKRGVIKDNTAARKKSRLSARIKKSDLKK